MPPKSDVWKHFSKTAHNSASCNVCKKNIKSSGNTTNLIGHIKAKHKAIYSKHFMTSTPSKSTQSTPAATSGVTEITDLTEEMPSTSRACASTSMQQASEYTGKKTF